MRKGALGYEVGSRHAGGPRGLVGIRAGMGVAVASSPSPESGAAWDLFRRVEQYRDPECITIETPGGSRHEWLPTTAAVAPEIKLTEPAHVPEVGAGGFALA